MFSVVTSLHLTADMPIHSTLLGSVAYIAIGGRDSHAQILGHDSTAFRALGEALLKTAAAMDQADEDRVAQLNGRAATHG